MSCWCCKYVRWFEMIWEYDPTWTSQALMGVKLMVSHCNVNAFGSSPSAPLIHKGSWGCKDHHMWTCSLKRPSKKKQEWDVLHLNSYKSLCRRTTQLVVSVARVETEVSRAHHQGVPEEETQVNAMRIDENCEVSTWCKVNLCPLFLLPLVVTTPSLLHSTLGLGQPVQKGGLLLQCLRWFQCWASIFLFLVLKLTCHHADNLHSTICLGNDLCHNVNNIRSEMHLNCHMNSITHTALG